MTLSFYYIGSNVVILRRVEMRCTYQISWSDLIACLRSHGTKLLRLSEGFVIWPLRHWTKTRNVSFCSITVVSTGRSNQESPRELTVNVSADGSLFKKMMSTSHNSACQATGISHRWQIQLQVTVKKNTSSMILSHFSKALVFVWNPGSPHYFLFTANSKRPIKTGLVYNNHEWLWAITMKTIYGSLHRSSVCVV